MGNKFCKYEKHEEETCIDSLSKSINMQIFLAQNFMLLQNLA